MAELDWPGDPYNGFAHETELTISDAAFALPHGSVITSSDSHFLLEEKKSPCPGILPTHSKKNGNPSTLPPPPSSDVLGDGNEVVFPFTPYPSLTSQENTPPQKKTPKKPPQTLTVFPHLPRWVISPGAPPPPFLSPTPHPVQPPPPPSAPPTTTFFWMTKKRSRNPI